MVSQPQAPRVSAEGRCRKPMNNNQLALLNSRDNRFITRIGRDQRRMNKPQLLRQ